jgi:hypothetical protein
MKRNRYIAYLVLLLIVLSLCITNIIYIIVTNLQLITQESTMYIPQLCGALLPNIIGLGLLIAGFLSLNRSRKVNNSEKNEPPTS